MRDLLLLVPFLLFTISTTSAQSASTEPSPTPKPAAVRRTFDQFDLSNGPLSSSSSTVESYDQPTTIEPVEQLLFDTINQIGESASFLQEQLDRAIKEHAEISQDSPFGRFFIHRMNGIMNLSETHRFGLLGMPAVKSEPNKKLLFLVQDTANDIVQVVAIGPEGYTQSPDGWNGVSAKYKVPLLETAPNGLKLDKPALLTAMMQRMTANISRLKRQLVVKK